MNLKNSTAMVSAAFFVSACASGADKIAATYVSPMTYQHFECDQIRVEMQRVSARVAEVSGQQDAAARSDTVAMSVGLVIFWPALFFLASDNDKKAELGRLKGEYEALQQAGIEKRCFSPEEMNAINHQRTEPAAPRPPHGRPEA